MSHESPSSTTEAAEGPAHPVDERGDYTAVLLEELRGQMNVVIEALQECVTKREFHARFEAIDARFEAMDARFDAVDDALRGLRHDVDRSAQAASLHALEQRVTVLERRLGV